MDSHSPYEAGATVTALGNTGSLEKTGFAFDGWSAAADGSGSSYGANTTFTIAADTTLYAKWESLSALPAPTGLRASVHGYNGIDLFWDNIDGAVSYKVYQSVATDYGWEYPSAYEVSETSHTFSYLNNWTYYFKVSAVSESGDESQLSPYSSVEVATSLAPPSNLQAMASGNSVILSWTPVSNAEFYQIYRNDNYSSYPDIFKLLDVRVSSASYTDSGLVAGTYYYKVGTVADGWASPASDHVSAVVGGD